MSITRSQHDESGFPRPTGRRIPVQPRVRAADGSGELPAAAYELFSQTEVLGRLALERMLGGLSGGSWRWTSGMLRPSTCWGPAISGSARTGPAISGSSPSRGGWIARGVSATGGRAEFTWEGNDESDPASGRSWAVLEEDESLRGHIYFHLGDDSGFRAVRAKDAQKPAAESNPRG
jgi:hypothetical protein